MRSGECPLPPTFQSFGSVRDDAEAGLAFRLEFAHATNAAMSGIVAPAALVGLRIPVAIAAPG